MISDTKEYLDWRRNEPLFEGSSTTSLLKGSPNKDIETEAKKCKCDALKPSSKFSTRETTKHIGDDVKIQWGEVKIYCPDLKTYLTD